MYYLRLFVCSEIFFFMYGAFVIRVYSTKILAFFRVYMKTSHCSQMYMEIHLQISMFKAILE